MSAPPLVSAIVPVHDGEAYLREALDSVLAQDYAPLELIVVDDGSRDGSAGIAAAEPRARLLRQPRAGVSAARNAGAAAARGALLAFLDQDDVWAPGKLRRQVAALHAHPEAGYALGRQRVFFEGEPPTWWRAAGLEAEHDAYFPGALLVRREVFDRIGAFRDDAPPAEGADWLLRAQELGIPHVVVEEVVLRKRIHHANQSRDTALVRAQVLRAIKLSLDRRRSS